MLEGRDGRPHPRRAVHFLGEAWEKLAAGTHAPPPGKLKSAEGDIDHLEVADGPQQRLILPKETGELPNVKSPSSMKDEAHQTTWPDVPVGKRQWGMLTAADAIP